MSWLASFRSSFLISRLTPALLMCLVSACEESPKAEGAQKAAQSAQAAVTPAKSAAPEPKPEAKAPKVKKKLEDCPKGTLEFASKVIEDEVRRKLQKPEGAISPAELKKVRSLNISSAKLDELDVCMFSHLTGLKELFLGPGDYDDLSPIAGATQLESLRASINQVRDVTPLAKMTKLDRLDLGRTQVSDITPLAELTVLTELQLDDTPVEDLSPLAKLTKLESLSIQRTRVKDLSALKAHKKLKFLYASGTPADDDPMAFAPVRANGTKVINN